MPKNLSALQRRFCRQNYLGNSCIPQVFRFVPYSRKPTTVKTPTSSRRQTRHLNSVRLQVRMELLYVKYPGWPLTSKLLNSRTRAWGIPPSESDYTLVHIPPQILLHSPREKNKNPAACELRNRPRCALHKFVGTGGVYIGH